MTHDELFVTVDRAIAKTDAVVGLQFCRPSLFALRAVVELHKPYLYPEDDKVYCYNCAESYPCPTIQAIQKELI